MSRSGYNEDCDGGNELYLYRANVDRATHGRRGQALLRALLAALDAMPEKRLVAAEFQTEGGEVCAFGALGRQRGIDMSKWDQAAQQDDDDWLAYMLSKEFNIAEPLAREIMWANDEFFFSEETPEHRFQRVRQWVVEQIHA